VTILKEILSQYPKAIIKKAATVKAFFFDVDGVLTNGDIIYDDGGKEYKHFSVKDGYIISHLKKAGVIVGIITGRESKVVALRAAELKLDFCHQGILDKFSVLEKMAKYHQLKMKQIAYMGDDINDLKCLSAVGLSASPSDAMHYVQSRVDFVARAGGGRGAVRELADLILAAKGKLDEAIK
jgi:3-deoxy-D-manno-octulosonate 8-phosphate phosphatase (KDO 8-P phosphatase)